MSKVLYLDCSSGASGDMLLGAMLDLGLPLEELRRALSGMLPGGWDISAGRVQRSGIAATQFKVIEPVTENGSAGHGHRRHLPDIIGMIEATALPPRVKAKAIALFRRLGEVEAEIHGIPVGRVHFHEVGAIDSIVDIVGTVWAVDHLGIETTIASPLNVGSGTVETEHGRLPVPAPATLRLLEGVPVFSAGTPMELVTPTGALLVTGHAAAYGAMPSMVVTASGYGAGGRDTVGHPNVLRAVVGEMTDTAAQTRVSVLECNIDDMNPQIFGAVLDRLYEAGALEVFFTPIQMKKNRPGTLLTAITPLDRREHVLDVLFGETTTIGIRHHDTDRECLDRELIWVATAYGRIRVKVSRRRGVVMTASPEFDDCAKLAADHHVPIKEVQAAAVSAYRTISGGV